MALFDHLDRALRWLREERRRRQYEIAEAAGVTKAMLSAYETGRQKPSLETLEKLLTALDCDLADLQRALDIFHRHSVRDQPPRVPRPVAARAAPAQPAPAPPRDEQALAEVLESLHRLLLHLHQTTSAGAARKLGRGEGLPRDEE